MVEDGFGGCFFVGRLMSFLSVPTRFIPDQRKNQCVRAVQFTDQLHAKKNAWASQTDFLEHDRDHGENDGWVKSLGTKLAMS